MQPRVRHPGALWTPLVEAPRRPGKALSTGAAQTKGPGQHVTFHATTAEDMPRMLDPVIVLDAHDGSLAYEIPQEHMVVKQGTNHLYVALDEDALQAYARVADAQVALVPDASDKKAKPTQTTFWIEEDFRNCAPGKTNMKAFVMLMKRDWEKMHSPVVDEEGVIDLGSTKLLGPIRYFYILLVQRLPS